MPNDPYKSEEVSVVGGLLVDVLARLTSWGLYVGMAGLSMGLRLTETSERGRDHAPAG